MKASLASRLGARVTPPAQAAKVAATPSASAPAFFHKAAGPAAPPRFQPQAQQQQQQHPGSQQRQQQQTAPEQRPSWPAKPVAAAPQQGELPDLTARNAERFGAADDQTIGARVALLKEQVAMEYRQLDARPSSTDEAVHGTCPDMCPAHERYCRALNGRGSVEGLLFNFEVRGGSVSHPDVIKEYPKAAAAKKQELPSWLRPLPTLQLTMEYMMHRLVNEWLPRMETDNDLLNWYVHGTGRVV